VGWPGVLEHYRAFLAVSRRTPVVTLLEGNTPLVPSRALARRIGRPAQVYLKYEGANPTGSFKDRGMTLAISKAVEAGSAAVLCASTGNTSASASAYAARAGLRSIVLLPSGAIALGKLSQALIHGARVVPVDANFDACLALAKALAREHRITLVNSVNPFRLEGQKTCAFEICDRLGRAPDVQCMPVGNAGNITAHWKGYREYLAQSRISRLPVLLGFQARGAAPLVLGRTVANPKTIATAIRIGNPASWQGAVAAARESRGAIRSVTDREILEAYSLLAREDGLFAEPASAASVAGLLNAAREGVFKRMRPSSGGRSLVIVCILTGHGLKDPDRAIQSVRLPSAVAPSLSAIRKVLKLRESVRRIIAASMKYLVIRCEDRADRTVVPGLLEGAKAVHLRELSQAGAAGLLRPARQDAVLDRFALHTCLLGLGEDAAQPSAGQCYAAAGGAVLAAGEVAWACDLVTQREGALSDVTAGEIPTAQSAELIAGLNQALGNPARRWAAGAGSHHILITGASDELAAAQDRAPKAPEQLVGRTWKRSLPRGAAGAALRALLERMADVLDAHPVNRVRADLGENPANLAWLWGASPAGGLPDAPEGGVRGVILSDEFLLRGLAALQGMQCHRSLRGADERAFEKLRLTADEALGRSDLVYLHVAVRSADPVERLCAIERLDQLVIKPLLERLPGYGPWRLLTVIDGPGQRDAALVALGTGLPRQPLAQLDQASLQESPLTFRDGGRLFAWLTAPA
jgi:threonine synthase